MSDSEIKNLRRKLVKRGLNVIHARLLDALTELELLEDIGEGDSIVRCADIGAAIDHALGVVDAERGSA